MKIPPVELVKSIGIVTSSVGFPILAISNNPSAFEKDNCANDELREVNSSASPITFSVDDPFIPN